jgi:Ca2+/Na+ antiporter
MRDDAWWMLGTSIALYPLIIRGMKLSRVEGGVLFGIYLVYISLLLR